MMPRWISVAGPAAVAAALVIIGWPSAAYAQQGCELGPGSSLLVRNPDGRGGNIVYLSTPHFVCEDDVEIWADSAVAYSTDAMSLLIGDVRYIDRTRELTAREARYFTEVGRLQAQGDVVVTDREDGTRVENGDLVYLRQTDLRAEESMTVTTGRDGRRPRATIPPPEPDSVEAAASPDSVAAERDETPYLVVGDRLFFHGADDFSAAGDVEIERDSLFAYADSADFVAESEELLLVGSARVLSASYELVGRSITMGTSAAGDNEIRALREAVLTGEDLTLTAPLIKLYLVDGAVERLVAVPGPAAGDEATEEEVEGPVPVEAPGAVAAAPDSTGGARPIAVAERFELTADSLELTAPGDVVERIFAAGRARSVSQARDSLNVEGLPEVARQDWLEGDTIVINLEAARPDSLAPASGTPGEEAEREYEIETIVARVGARSLYRLPPQDSTARPGVDLPAVHYVLGDEITIHMSEGEVQAMEVVGQTRGVHLEPLRRAAATGDTAVADTSGVGAVPSGADGAASGQGGVVGAGGVLPSGTDGRSVPAPESTAARPEPRRRR